MTDKIAIIIDIPAADTAAGSRALDDIDEALGTLPHAYKMSALDDFEPLRDWMSYNEAAGTVFVPDDLQSEWEQWVDMDPDLPAWDDARDELLRMWEWRKGVDELLTERGFEIIQQGIAEMVDAAKKKAERTGEPLDIQARY